MGMATIQLRLRTWFGHRCGLVCLLAVPGIAEPAFAARDTALTIMTTSLEMLQIKPFSSKRYPSDHVRHLKLLYLVETCRRHFIIQAHAHWIHEYANEADDDDDVPKPAQSLGTPVPRQKSTHIGYTQCMHYTSTI